mgnify:CR=1 FL=1
MKAENDTLIMIVPSTIDSIPIWAVGLGLFVMLSISIEVGFQLGRRIAVDQGLSKHPVEAAVSTALLGLMAFMTAFTFNSAMTRHAELRHLGTVDAKLAQKLHNLSDLLPVDNASASKGLIREYLQSRSAAIERQNADELNAVIVRSREIQDDLWAIASSERVRGMKNATPHYINGLTALIENDTARQAAALSNRLPAVILYALGSLAVLAVGLLGLSSGLHGRRSRLVATVFIAAYSMIFVLIVDLDRPLRSLFKLGDPVGEGVLDSFGE